MKEYQMRTYKKNGKLEKELYFDDFETMFIEYCKQCDSLKPWKNPTLWQYNYSFNSYFRILGY